MTFKVLTEATFTHPVKVHVPVDGGYDTQTMSVTYRVLPLDVFSGFDIGTQQGTADFLRAAIVKLDDIVGGDEKPLVYSDALRDKVLGLPYARSALAHGYFDGVSGAKRGN